MIRIVFSILIVFLFACNVSAQEKMLVKRIYLFDVTKSMVGEGKINGKVGTDTVFEDLKEKLASTLLAPDMVCDDDEIVIIPFTNKTFDVIRGYGKDRYANANAVRSMATKPGDTNIDAAWLAGINEMDEKKVNLLFLMTDGIHNCGPDVSQLYKHLGEWEDNGKDLAFYFMLTKNAESAKIDSIAKENSGMETVHSSNIKINILQLAPHHQINIKGYESFDDTIYTISNSCYPINLKNVTMRLDDRNNYSINLNSCTFFTDKVVFTLTANKPIQTLPISEDNTISFFCNNSDTTLHYKTYIKPDKIKIEIINLGTRTMKIY